jgi:hypothetical protein
VQRNAAVGAKHLMRASRVSAWAIERLETSEPTTATLRIVQCLDKNKGAPTDAVPLEIKTAARRPGAKEGGREEEEKRSGIAARRTGRLRSMESVTFAWTSSFRRSSTIDVATECDGDMRRRAN